MGNKLTEIIGYEITQEIRKTNRDPNIIAQTINCIAGEVVSVLFYW
ncbi:MAG: hypothetical protein R6V74_04860 [Lutibacter sp.]